MTMRRKGSFIVALLAMMVMLSACGWLDQLWILAKTSRALTTMESVTADITIEAEGKAGNRYLWLPYHVARTGCAAGTDGRTRSQSGFALAGRQRRASDSAACSSSMVLARGPLAKI